MKTLSKTLTLLVAGFMIMGCEKDSENADFKNAEVLDSQISVQKNTVANPFEFVGELHNEALEHVRLNKTSWDINGIIDSDSIEGSVTQFFIDKVNDYPDFDEKGLLVSMNEIYLFQDSIYNAETNLADFMQHVDFSSEARNYLLNLANVDTEDFERTIEDILSIESEIIADDFANREICLMACAVFRHSSTYWYHNLGRGDWAYRAGPDWGAVATADLGGALLGGASAFASSAPTLVFGPGGVVCTTAGGAVIGAAKASAMSAALTGFFSMF